MVLVDERSTKLVNIPAILINPLSPKGQDLASSSYQYMLF